MILSFRVQRNNIYRSSCAWSCHEVLGKEVIPNKPNWACQDIFAQRMRRVFSLSFKNRDLYAGRTFLWHFYPHVVALKDKRSGIFVVLLSLWHIVVSEFAKAGKTPVHVIFPPNAQPLQPGNSHILIMVYLDAMLDAGSILENNWSWLVFQVCGTQTKAKLIKRTFRKKWCQDVKREVFPTLNLQLSSCNL